MTTKPFQDLAYQRLGVLGFTGTLNERFLKHFRANGATATDYNTAFQQYLIARGATASSPFNDQYRQYLTAKGYTGSIMDQQQQWGEAGLPL